jgi:hypothetical protein
MTKLLNIHVGDGSDHVYGYLLSQTLVPYEGINFCDGMLKFITNKKRILKK